MLCTMKSSLYSDEIFTLRLQMKSNPPLTNPALAGFHREAISSIAGGFIPQKADLVEKSTHCLGRRMCAFFWSTRWDLNPNRRRRRALFYPIKLQVRLPYRTAFWCIKPQRKSLWFKVFILLQ